MLILFEQLNPFLDFFSRALLFLPNCRSICLSMHLTLCNFQCIALEPEILWKLERWFASAFHKLLFPCCARFAWIWTYKAHDLTDHQLTVGSFLPTNLIATMASIGKDRQISRWHWYFQQLLFPFVPQCALPGGPGQFHQPNSFVLPCLFHWFHFQSQNWKKVVYFCRWLRNFLTDEKRKKFSVVRIVNRQFSGPMDGLHTKCGLCNTFL